MAICEYYPATGQVLKTFEALTDSPDRGETPARCRAFCVYRKVPFSDRARKMVRAAESWKPPERDLRPPRTMEWARRFSLRWPKP